MCSPQYLNFVTFCNLLLRRRYPSNAIGHDDCFLVGQLKFVRGLRLVGGGGVVFFWTVAASNKEPARMTILNGRLCFPFQCLLSVYASMVYFREDSFLFPDYLFQYARADQNFYYIPFLFRLLSRQQENVE